jgi:hypothetical protein
MGDRFAKHAQVYHFCVCGRRVTGNAIWSQRRACDVWRAQLDAEATEASPCTNRADGIECDCPTCEEAERNNSEDRAMRERGVFGGVKMPEGA